MFQLHGLAIDVVAEPAPPRRARADVRWVRRRVEAVPQAPAPDGWAWRVFTGQAGAACRFEVSPDGREVVSYITDVVREPDERGLFAEAVMRTVMRRLGIVSFHAAALARDGAAVLIMGGKGAGKSSFAAALSQSGWSLMADDLARVLRRDGAWRVAPGHRQTRLNPDVAVALGYDLVRLEHRWTPGQPREETENKRVVSHTDGGVAEDLPIAAVFALGPRLAELQTASVTPAPAAERLALLLRNLSDDPLDALSAPSAEAKAAAISLLKDVPVMRLSLPDDLAGLRGAAAALRWPA